MLPIEWLGVLGFVGLPLCVGLFGMGDLRKADLRYLVQLQGIMWIPGVWALVTSWSVIYTLIGVSGYIFWRDSSASYLYDAGIALNLVSILCMGIWMRLAKMKKYAVTSFVILLLGVCCTSIAALVIYGIAENWISFGVYILVTVVFFLCVVWSGRVAFGDASSVVIKEKAGPEEGLTTAEYEQTARDNYAPKQAAIGADASSGTRNRFSTGNGGAALLFSNSPSVASK
jgi:tryptophan-rich sensory protein